MTEKVTHLMEGHANDDGTVTVTSIITLCCKVAFPKGLGTFDPAAVTCPGSADSCPGCQSREPHMCEEGGKR